VSERGFMISVDSEAAFIYYIYKVFSPEHVSYFRCDKCQALSSSTAQGQVFRQLEGNGFSLPSPDSCESIALRV
jgi:hypothetical protein